MKKSLALVATAFLLASCGHYPKFHYVMPTPPAELMTPPAKLQPINPYKSEVGVVPATPKPK